MPVRYCLRLLVISVLGWLSAAAGAADFEPLPLIQAAAEQHLIKLLANSSYTLHIKATELDSRLRLAACPAALEVFLPSGNNIGSRVTTGVRCNQGTPWTIYLPVTIEAEVPALVLNKALARSNAVSGLDVETRVQRVPGVGTDNLTSVSELSGKRLKRDLSAGTALSPGMFEPEMLIRRGQQVTVIAMVAGIEVRTQAVALSDGSASSRIRVKNLNSAKVVEGMVDSNSVVRVDL
jgi:flagella basal body P-ring formation protein FlgA